MDTDGRWKQAENIAGGIRHQKYYFFDGSLNCQVINVC